MWMGMQRYFYQPWVWMHSLWVYLQGLAGWNAFWNVPGSEPNPALECEVKCWRYKYRVWISKSLSSPALQFQKLASEPHVSSAALQRISMPRVAGEGGGWFLFWFGFHLPIMTRTRSSFSNTSTEKIVRGPRQVLAGESLHSQKHFTAIL